MLRPSPPPAIPEEELLEGQESPEDVLRKIGPVHPEDQAGSAQPPADPSFGRRNFLRRGLLLERGGIHGDRIQAHQHSPPVPPYGPVPEIHRRARAVV